MADLINFRSTRHLTKDITFLDKAGIFDFQTIAIGETIRELVNTFKEFSQLIQRMPSHKAPGFWAVPADLFKQAPAPFPKTHTPPSQRDTSRRVRLQSGLADGESNPYP